MDLSNWLAIGDDPPRLTNKLMVYAPILPIEPQPAPDELQVAVIKGRNQLVKPVGIRRGE